MTAQPPPTPRRAPLAALWRIETVRLRAAAVARSVQEGRSAHWRWDAAAHAALLAQAGTGSSGARAVSAAPADDPWSALGPAALEWWRSTASQPPIDRLRAAADLAILLAWIETQAAERWTYRDQGARQAVDRLALPLQQQGSDELFAMLDRFTPGAMGAAPPTDSPADPPADLPPGTPPNAGALRGPNAVAVATLRAFEAGVFSSQAAVPARADGQALQQLDVVALKAALGVSAARPLPGLDTRAEGLAACGRELSARAKAGGSGRLSACFDPWIDEGTDERTDTDIDACDLAEAVVALLSRAGVRGTRVLGQSAGDTWAHLWAGTEAGRPRAAGHARAPHEPPQIDRGSGGYLPLHRAAQRAVRALAHPWQWAREAGAALPAVVGLDRLADHSGANDIVAAMRCGVLVPRHASELAEAHALASAWTVEARAVALVLAGVVTHISTEAGPDPLQPVIRYDSGWW